jgi:MFS family permease
LSEELPSQVRGRANGLLGGFAAVGAAVPPALLAPLEALGFDWRALFVMGAIPLLLFPLYLSHLTETRAFRTSDAATRRFDPIAEWALLRDLFTRARRVRLAGVTVLWFSINFWSGTALGFFTIYVFRERGWDAGDLLWLPVGTLPFGFAGYALCGVAMDRLGRRRAATLYLIASFLATACCYQSESKLAIYIAWFMMIGLAGIWTIATTWTMELFPTRIRATAFGVTANLLGRMGMVIGPIVAGSLSTTWNSTGNAITALAGLNLLCLPIVWWILPESRGLDLVESAESDASGSGRLAGI